MDEIYGAVLEKICAPGNVGRNIVLSAEELSDALPADGREAGAALKELARGGYIDIKYAGGGMYCVTPLKCFIKEIKEPPPTAAAEEVKISTYMQNKGSLKVFLPAFLGGLSGGALAGIITAVIVWLC